VVLGAGRPDPRLSREPVSGFRVNMLTAVSNAGRLRFQLSVGSFSDQLFIDFLGRLLQDCGGRKIHFIVHGHPVHRAKLVSA
jgi:DDE superfamily endonuclease